MDDDRKLEAVRGVSLEVREGEIVGIAGVVGNGQSELVEAITGLRRPKVRAPSCFASKDITHDGPRSTIAAGVSVIPEDRQRRGLVLEFDLVENIALGDHRRAPYSRKQASWTAVPWTTWPRRASPTSTSARRASPSPPPTSQAATSRRSSSPASSAETRELLIAAQPTRGLDVGAIEFVHRQILAARDNRKAVLLVSMELEEIQSLSDRILVMFEGRVVAEFVGRDGDRRRARLLHDRRRQGRPRRRRRTCRLQPAEG